MRRLLVAGFIAVAGQGAYAADMPDLPVLRGSFSEPQRAYRTIWQGFYVGGQAGYGSSNMGFEKFSPATTGVITWPVLEGTTHRSSMFGGFAGYNAQFEDVVIGVEGSYMHGVFSGAAFNESTTTTGVAGPVAPGLNLVVTRRTDGAMTVKDSGSLRIRGGYTMGNFLPYAFAGFSMGRADTLRGTSITGTYTGTTVVNDVSGLPRTTTLSTNTNNQFVHGVSAGVGLDWMLFGGMFLRAEYEYLQFTSTINTNIHSVRAGVGYKF